MPQNRIERYLATLPKQKRDEIKMNLNYEYPLLSPIKWTDSKLMKASEKTLTRLALILGVDSALDFFLSSEYNFKIFIKRQNESTNE